MKQVPERAVIAHEIAVEEPPIPGPVAPSGPRDIELVDDAGRGVGTATKREAHLAPGRRHRAVSVFLTDSTGTAVLVQRRSLAKYHSPGLWSNTVCGHPAPGEAPALAASRRLLDELGLELRPSELREVGTATYNLRDSITGLVESEFNHVYVGRTNLPPAPRAEEVEAVAWREIADLPNVPRDDPAAWTAWFSYVLAVALPAMAPPGADHQ